MAAADVFMDTVGLLALLNRDDALHKEAQQVHKAWTAQSCRWVSSDWVLSEFLGGASRLGTRQAAVRMIRRLQQSPRVVIVPATRLEWWRAFELYAARSDKEWSLVDCSSILICEAQGIRYVFTHDRHFIQAGLEILLHGA